jgi:hypothetical protein
MSSVRERYGEAFGGPTTRLGFKVSSISEIMRGLRGAAQGVRQLTCEVQSRTTDAGAQGALPARRPKSYPRSHASTGEGQDAEIAARVCDARARRSFQCEVLLRKIGASAPRKTASGVLGNC